MARQPEIDPDIPALRRPCALTMPTSRFPTHGFRERAFVLEPLIERYAPDLVPPARRDDYADLAQRRTSTARSSRAAGPLDDL